jgi:putative hemolysin
METYQAVYLVLIVVCIGFSGFFSAMETAVLSLQRVRLEHLVETGIKGANHIAAMVEKPEKFLSIVLFGNNLVNTAAAALVTARAMELWGLQGIIYATLIITVVILIFAETTPKTFAAQHSERVALLFVRPLLFVAWLFSPVVSILSRVASFFLRMLGSRWERHPLASPEEIRAMISVGHKEGTVEPTEARLLHKAFEFGERPVREVMVPRPDIIALEAGMTLTQFFTIYAGNPRSRYPVFRETIDNVVAVLAVKDVMMALARETEAEAPLIEELMRPAYLVPETKKIGDLFAEMRERQLRMAIIIDEYGSTAGIVTTTLLVEEIVGDIGDEIFGFDRDYEIINENTCQVDGSMRIEDVNEEIGLVLPESEDYETLAGFILSMLGHIPRPHEQLRFNGLKFVITEMKGRKIETVLVTRESTPQKPQ